MSDIYEEIDERVHREWLGPRAHLWTDGYYRNTPEPGQPMKLAMIDDRIRSMIQQLDEVLEEE